jgi:carboxymethylenebutenolidase
MLRKVTCLAVALLVVAFAARAQAGGKMITYPSGSETLSGYLAAPDGTGKKPAVVVIQEWWGVNDFIKKKAEFFAAQGYVTLAPDLYHGKVATDPDQAHQLMMGLEDSRGVADLKAAVAYLRARPDVDASRIASVGWCMGGKFSLRLALAEPKLAGAVIYYGQLVSDEKAIAALSVPLLGNFGAEDQGPSPQSVRDFEKKAKAAGKSLDFKIYEGAGHGFASFAVKPEAAKDADGRTDSFLAKVLKGVKS